MGGHSTPDAFARRRAWLAATIEDARPSRIVGAFGLILNALEI
jgi:hypothetical protein